MAIIPNVKSDVIKLFQTFVQEHNELIKLFKTTMENMPRDECPYKIYVTDLKRNT